MQPSMLYAKVGVALDFDAYEIDGIANNTVNRSAVKKAFMQVINGKNRHSIAKPKDWPSGLSWKKTIKAVEAQHVPIKKCFYSGIWIKLQQVDSEIAEDVMLEMMKRNIHYGALMEQMEKFYEKRVG